MKRTIITINGFEAHRGSNLTGIYYQYGNISDERKYWVHNYSEFEEWVRHEMVGKNDEIILSDSYGDEITIEEFNSFMAKQPEQPDAFFTEWYAIQMDEDDNDWGTGSFDKDEAIEMARERGYKYIATIEGEWDVDGEPITEGICIEVEEV